MIMFEKMRWRSRMLRKRMWEDGDDKGEEDDDVEHDDVGEEYDDVEDDEV